MQTWQKRVSLDAKSSYWGIFNPKSPDNNVVRTASVQHYYQTQVINRQDELEVKKFTQINEDDGTCGVQFPIETEASDRMIQVGGLVSGHTAKFCKHDSVASDEGIIVKSKLCAHPW